MGSTNDSGAQRLAPAHPAVPQVEPPAPAEPVPLGWTFDLRGRGSAASRFAVLGAHAAGVVAEMGDLLGAVRGYAQLLAAEGRPGATLDPRGTARQILRVAESGADLCARLESHITGTEPPASDFDLNGLVVCVFDLVRDLLGKDIRLALDPGQGPLTVHGRVHDIEQVLLALILNARDAMPDGGRLRIRTNRVEHVQQRAGAWAGPWARVQVFDTGLPFAEAEYGARTVDVAHLAEASRAMQRHDGWLRATSMRNRGQLTGNQLDAFLPLSE